MSKDIIEQSKTKICKFCKTLIPREAKICPQCGKRVKGGKLKWIIIAIVGIIIISAIFSGENNKKDSDKKIGEVEKATQTETNNKKGLSADKKAESNVSQKNESKKEIENKEEETKSEEKKTEPVISEEKEKKETKAEKTEEKVPVKEDIKTVYYVGDILQDGNMKIVYMSSGEHKEENQFMQPKEGNILIYLQFSFENVSKKSDASISFYSFECYADGYAVDMFYGGDDDLSATLSAGRATTGYVYFEIPKEAKEIEVEYTTNVFTEEKITFVYEGEKDSKYVLELNTTPTAGAARIGDTVEVEDLKISYLSCKEYKSDNMFVKPADGFRFVSCEFEFENIGKKDEMVSGFSFDGYADGKSCKSCYFPEDSISATISSGRKAKGTVTFEVPIDAKVIEYEYLANLWTAERVVFTVEVGE